MLSRYLIILLFFFNYFDGVAHDTICLREYYKGLKTTEVIISGQKYCFLFDTGGGETFISPEIATKMAKRVYGCESGIRMTGEKINYAKSDSVYIQLGNILVLHDFVGVWDVMSVLPKEFKKVDGIISLKTFKSLCVTIDLNGNRLIVENNRTYRKRIKEMKLVNCRFANGHDGQELNLLTQVKFEGNCYWFLFDSGNIDALIVSENCELSNIKECTFGNNFIQIDNMKNQIQKRSIIYNGVLDYEVISKHVFTINFNEKKLWIS